MSVHSFACTCDALVDVCVNPCLVPAGEDRPHSVAEEHAQHDDHLLGAHQGAPDLRRGDLRDVDGRGVHAEADAQAVDQEPHVDAPEHGREGGDAGAEEVQQRSDLHLFFIHHAYTLHM